MDKLALEMETFEEILERFEMDVKRAKECGDYSQVVRPLRRCTFCMLHADHEKNVPLCHTSTVPHFSTPLIRVYRGCKKWSHRSLRLHIEPGGKHGLREQYPRRDQ